MPINKSKLIIWLVAIVLLIVLLFIGIHLVNGKIQSAHDAAFDAGRKAEAQKQDELAQQIADLEAARQAALKQAAEAETRAANADLQRAQDQKAIETARAQAATFKAKYAQEHTRYIAALAANNSANLDPCTLYTNNCERAKALGILAADKSCLCHQLR